MEFLLSLNLQQQILQNSAFAVAAVPAPHHKSNITSIKFQTTHYQIYIKTVALVLKHHKKRKTNYCWTTLA